MRGLPIHLQPHWKERKEAVDAKREYAVYDLQHGDSIRIVAVRYQVSVNVVKRWRKETLCETA